MPNEERLNCPHYEKIEEFSGFALGTCIYCGQVKRYDRLDIRIPPSIVIIGRFNGAVATAQEEVTSSLEKVAGSGRAWYQSHKKDMIEDLITMDYDAFLEKWKIKRQIVSHLKSDKLYKSRVGQTELPVKMERKENKLLSLGTFTCEAASELPAFPPFNEQWSDYVKTNWFETYQALKGLEVKQ